MTLDEYKTKILGSTEEDWTRISCWGAGAGPSFRDAVHVWAKGSGEFHNLEVDSHSEVLSLKPDLLISVACGITHNDDFIEDWANSFPDKHASSAFVDFFYANQLIFRDIYVSVDGGRCRLPLPDINFDKSNQNAKFLTVPRDKFQFFRILNNANYDYDSYISRAGIKVVDAEWMS
jgi:hypothetical protein